MNVYFGKFPGIVEDVAVASPEDVVVVVPFQKELKSVFQFPVKVPSTARLETSPKKLPILSITLFPS